jgi:hypothetical protein
MLKEVLTISLIDLSNYVLNLFNINRDKSNTSRWFYLHSLTNCFITYYSLTDLVTCITNIDSCYKIKWNYYSYITYNLSILLHIYHSLFFDLTNDDKLHHILMVAICGTLCYIQNSILSSFALFFLTGLPGAIDYLLLYLVKQGVLNPLFEKRAYTYISAYIRAPGCTLTLAIGIPAVIKYYNTEQYLNSLMILLIILLIYWNGQYYLIKSHESYIKKTIEYNNYHYN